MATVQEIFDSINTNIGKNPEKATSVNSVFQFEIDDDTYSIDLRESTTENWVTKAAHDDANVTIKTTAETWVGITDGSINPMQAFMMGKIKVQGDMGLAMKLQNVLSMAG